MIADAVLEALLDAGATAEMIVAAVKADNDATGSKLAEKRAKDAERQRQHRASRSTVSQDVTVTECNNADVTNFHPLSLPPKEINSNPPTHTPGYIQPARGSFPKPDWADAGIWRDFLKNRKAKKLTNTETSHRRFLGDIEKHTTAEWPPGRLLEHAVGQGWGSIHKPTETRNATNNGKSGQQRDGFMEALDIASESFAGARRAAN